MYDNIELFEPCSKLPKPKVFVWGYYEKDLKGGITNLWRMKVCLYPEKTPTGKYVIKEWRRMLYGSELVSEIIDTPLYWSKITKEKEEKIIMNRYQIMDI